MRHGEGRYAVLFVVLIAKKSYRYTRLVNARDTGVRGLPPCSRHSHDAPASRTRDIGGPVTGGGTLERNDGAASFDPPRKPTAVRNVVANRIPGSLRTETDSSVH